MCCELLEPFFLSSVRASSPAIMAFSCLWYSYRRRKHSLSSRLGGLSRHMCELASMTRSTQSAQGERILRKTSSTVAMKVLEATTLGRQFSTHRIGDPCPRSSKGSNVSLWTPRVETQSGEHARELWGHAATSHAILYMRGDAALLSGRLEGKRFPLRQVSSPAVKFVEVNLKKL